MAYEGKKGEDSKNSVIIPVDTINEQIVVAAALVDEQVRDQYVLKESADIFADADHGLIWDGMRTVLQRGKGFDMQQLHAEISGKVKIDYLRQLEQRYPKAPVNMQQHVSRLRWDFCRKQAAEDSVSEFLRALKDPSESPATVQGLAQRVAQSLQVSLDRGFMSNPKLVAAKQSEQIRKRREGHACYPFGLKELDMYPDGRHRMIPGLAPGQITLVTGASGSGKSVMAGVFGLQQARMGRKALYGPWEMGPGFTLEMMANLSYTLPMPDGSTKLMNKILGSRYNTSTGNLSEPELNEFSDRMEAIAEFVRFFDPPFYNDPGKSYTNDQSLSELYRMVSDSGCEVVIYDLWERCIPDGKPESERRALFTQQQIHRRTNTHGILVCQQKIKEIERKTDKRPARDTILGSSAWVEIADTIIGVYRAATARAIPDDTIELLILKQRFGKWPQALQFTWDGDLMTLTNGRDVEFEFKSITDKDLF